MENTSNKSYIIETIDTCYDIINYLLTTDSIAFKTDAGIVTSRDKKLVQYLLKYFKDIKNKYESKL